MKEEGAQLEEVSETMSSLEVSTQTGHHEEPLCCLHSTQEPPNIFKKWICNGLFKTKIKKGKFTSPTGAADRADNGGQQQGDPVAPPAGLLLCLESDCLASVLWLSE